MHACNRLIGLHTVRATQGAITAHNFVDQNNGVHRKKVNFDWRQVKVDQNKRGKISNPIWMTGCGGSGEVTVMTLQSVNFLTISPLSFLITISVLVSFNSRRLEPQFHYIYTSFFQLFSKLFNYHH